MSLTLTESATTFELPPLARKLRAASVLLTWAHRPVTTKANSGKRAKCC